MRRSHRFSPLPLWATLLALGAGNAFGQVQQVPRLSSILPPHNDAASQDYPLGMMWLVPKEYAAQQADRISLLNTLTAPSHAGLAAFIATLPTTGRVPVVLADARWLEAHPARDPRLGPDHRVLMPPRPMSVTVITPAGERCVVAHQPGLPASAYLHSCQGTTVAEVDWVWVAQPDGQVQRHGIGLWNEHDQDAPAPGAWLWGPPRAAGFTQTFSDTLAGFLATQGPALDAGLPPRVIYPTAAPQAPPPTPPGAASPLPDWSGASAPGHPAPPAARPAPAATTLPRSLVPTPSDWGSLGLMQTPSARMAPAGEARFTASRVWPYVRLNVFAQPFDWLEAGFRYTSIQNRLYGPQDFSGDQSYKDKSLDAKFRLREESAYLPAVAVGFRDMTGTGLFSGEYLVANKRFGATDWSAGILWGYGVGNNGTRNPLSIISKRFETRGNGVVETGKFNLSNYFAGPANYFGGVQWTSPDPRLTLKLEYDSNDYQAEPLGNRFTQKSHWNMGLGYRASRSTDLAIGFERGDRIMVSVNFHTALNLLSTRKVSDPARPPIRPERPTAAPDWAATARDIDRQVDWGVRRIEQTGPHLRLTFSEAQAPYWRDRLDTLTAIVHRDAPKEIDFITYAFEPNGVPTAQSTVDRALWVQQQTEPVPPHAMSRPIVSRAPAAAPGATALHVEPRSLIESAFSLNLQHALGGPDGFVLYQFVLSHRGRLNLGERTWLQSRLDLGVADNYDKYRQTGTSELPRVRTRAREYVTTSDLRLSNLQATHTGRLGRDQFYSVYGGYLESMFAGAGGEWLYRPFGSRVALGLDVNHVRQRDFNQGFGLQDYQVNTGHATLYWDTGWHDVQLNLSAGQYLAGDKGVTVDFSRTFNNGVTMGGYFTKTNVSSEQFGEGSFDKGIYVSIPFDVFLTRSSKTTGTFMWRPLTRDGGARLARAVSLYDLTRARDPRLLDTQPAPPAPHDAAPADRVSTAPSTPEPPTPAQLLERPMHDTRETALEQRLTHALSFQGFGNVRVEQAGPARLEVSLTSEQITPMSRAAHRAALTVLRHAPLTTRTIRIVFEVRGMPATAYEFFDLDKLDDYYSGLIDDAALTPYIAVRNLNPNAIEPEPLKRFGDVRRESDNRTLTDALTPDLRSVRRVVNDVTQTAALATRIDWTRSALTAGSLVLASRWLDDRADQFARDHANSRLLTQARNVGNAFPLLATGAAAAHALLADDVASQRVSYAAVEAAGAALVTSTALKRAIPRTRPENRDTPAPSGDARRSFPSNHTAVAWAVVTPYAVEYNAPWLYAAPLITNFARVQARRHWVSDTVAGSVLGYGLGRLFHAAGKRAATGPQVYVNQDEIGVTWPF